MRRSIMGADPGDFPNGRLAWDVLRLVADQRRGDLEVVDLAGCLHLKTYSLACLAAVGAASNSRVQLILPTDTNCRAHCLRMGVHRWFAATEEDQGSARVTNLPIEQLVSAPSGQFATRAIGLWMQQTGEQLPIGLQRDLESHIDEMVLNALGHSQSPVGCLVAGQGHPGAGMVEAVILDLGMTIRGHLIRNAAYAMLRDDVDAIERAMEEGVTGTPPGQLNLLGEPNSGVGLANLYDFCRADRCAISIVSGNACVCFVRGGQKVVQPVYSRFPGTLVNIRFYT